VTRVAALAVLLLAACASDPSERDRAVVSPLALGERESNPPAEDGAPKACAHVWEQVAMHPYTRIQNGVPLADLCAVSRCARCGEMRHDCRRPRR
jgi:hypothetical protein